MACNVTSQVNKKAKSAKTWTYEGEATLEAFTAKIRENHKGLAKKPRFASLIIKNGEDEIDDNEELKAALASENLNIVILPGAGAAKANAGEVQEAKKALHALMDKPEIVAAKKEVEEARAKLQEARKKLQAQTQTPEIIAAKEKLREARAKKQATAEAEDDEEREKAPKKEKKDKKNKEHKKK